MNADPGVMHAGKLLAQTPGSTSAGWGSCSGATFGWQVVQNVYISICIYRYILSYILNFCVLNYLSVVIFGV